MGWTRARRRPNRARRRPSLECLEGRHLLTASPPVNEIAGASIARAAYHVDGSGLSAAVIDTGVNYRHEALGGGFGPGFKVKAGYDFAMNDPNPDATWQHGTAVAGLIASNDPAHPGVAPGAGIVALRVFGDDNRGDFNRVADALQWVIDHHDQEGISVVNLSITDGNNYTNNAFEHDGGIGERISGLIHQLDELNIPVVSASGNSFDGQQGMGFTAVLGETVSVTGADASDHLLGNAQRLGTSIGGDLATDLAAPGSGLEAPVEGNGFAQVTGTSFRKQPR